MPSVMPNFVVTGSLLGGRGIEAHTIIHELLRIERRGRCLVVIWQDEEQLPVVDLIKKMPVEVLIVPPPSLEASGNMARQHLSFVSALPFFAPDEFIVRVRTDHNCRLRQIMEFIHNKVPADIGDKLIVGAVSLLLPGRVEDFNYAGFRRSFDRYNWCEGYFTEDYLPAINSIGLGGEPYFKAEPEMRWAGLYFSMKNPVAFYLYNKFNRYDFAYKFIEGYVNTACPVYDHPTIVRYVMHILAQHYEEDFLVVRDNPQLPVMPEEVFAFENDQISELVNRPDNRDIRVSSQALVGQFSRCAGAEDNWRQYLGPAWELREKEKKSPGAALEELHRFMAGEYNDAGPVYYPLGGQEKWEAPEDIQPLLGPMEAEEMFSTLRYAKSLLLSLRKLDEEKLDWVLKQFHQSGGVTGQHIDGFASVLSVLFCHLVGSGRYQEGIDILTDALEGSTWDKKGLVETLRICTTCYRLDENSAMLSAADLRDARYELPDSFHRYNLIGDFLFHIEVAKQNLPRDKDLQDFSALLEPYRNFYISD